MTSRVQVLARSRPSPPPLSPLQSAFGLLTLSQVLSVGRLRQIIKIAIKGYSGYPKLRQYRSPTIILFCVICRTLGAGLWPLGRHAVVVFCSRRRLVSLRFNTFLHNDGWCSNLSLILVPRFLGIVLSTRTLTVIPIVPWFKLSVDVLLWFIEVFAFSSF